ncbi:hypothetical protein GW17_00007635 [Ensete ventricosum]|nr:hypothetical protein GW17_00007635 [Ensete ventricosum]
MEQHDSSLASARVHILDLYLRKTLCFHSMFRLLCRLPLCDLGTSSSSTQVALLFSLH